MLKQLLSGNNEYYYVVTDLVQLRCLEQLFVKFGRFLTKQLLQLNMSSYLEKVPLNREWNTTTIFPSKTKLGNYTFF